MTDPIFNDKAMFSAKFALDGLARRSEVIGNNLANVDTPGYQAQALNFEQTLQRATSQSSRLTLSRTSSEHLTSGAGVSNTGMTTSPRQNGTWRTDGNNVSMDNELNEMAETGIRYQALSQMVTKKLLLLKSVASGR